VASVKIQLEFRMGGDGWSEIYYHGGSAPRDSKGVAQALVTERVKILCAVGVIHHVRISGTTPGSRSYRFPPTGATGGRVASKTRDAGAVTTTVGMYSADGVYRKLALRGMPDDGHNWNEAGQESTTIPGMTQTFLNYLKDQQFQIRHIVLPATDEGLSPIKDVSVAAGIVTFTTDSLIPVVGKKVKISGMKGLKASQFNGVWTVGSVAAGPPMTFSALTKRLIDPNFFYIKGTGRIRSAEPAAYTYVTINSFDDYDTTSTHKTGRPTDSHRGRRSLTR